MIQKMGNFFLTNKLTPCAHGTAERTRGLEECMEYFYTNYYKGNNQDALIRRNYSYRVIQNCHAVS